MNSCRFDGAEFYTIRANNEWAFISIHEPTGTFISTGSFGTFGYNWTAIGDRTLKQFLAELDYGYFFGKVATSQGEIFSPDKTIKGVKQHILETRKWGEIDKEQAREAWESALSVEAESPSDVHHFFDSLYNAKGIYRVYGGDLAGIERRERDPQCNGFWETIWPVFIAEIRKLNQ